MESGYHTDFWMDLETLCLRPARIQPFAEQLASRLRRYRVDAVCGALNEGAFVALMVAQSLRCEFWYAERFADPHSTELFPVRYRLPQALRRGAAGRHVAIVNDVISAGSAVRGAVDDVRALDGEIVVVAALLTVGGMFVEYARDRGIALEMLSHTDGSMWPPEDCPLCRSGEIPLETPTR